MAERRCPWSLPGTLSSYFEATPEERACLAAVPALQMDAAAWRAFAGGLHVEVVRSYHAGEITLERALQVVRSCSIGCTWEERARLIAITAVTCLDHRPQEPKNKVAHPLWVRRAGAMLVQWLRERRPDEPLAPTEHNNHTTPLLEDTIAVLRALELCDPVEPRTIMHWYREAKQAGVLTPDDGNPAALSPPTRS